MFYSKTNYHSAWRICKTLNVTGSRNTKVLAGQRTTSKIDEEVAFFPPIPSMPQKNRIKENDTTKASTHMSSYSLKKLKNSGRWYLGSWPSFSNYLEEPEADVNIICVREQQVGMRPWVRSRGPLRMSLVLKCNLWSCSRKRFLLSKSDTLRTTLYLFFGLGALSPLEFPPPGTISLKSRPPPTTHSSPSLSSIPSCIWKEGREEMLHKAWLMFICNISFTLGGLFYLILNSTRNVLNDSGNWDHSKSW